MIWITESKFRNIYGIELGVSSHILWKFVLGNLTVVVVVVVVVMVVRRRRNIRSCETDGICGQQERSTNTNCRKAPTQHSTHSCCRELEVLRENYKAEQDRVTERNKTNKESHT